MSQRTLVLLKPDTVRRGLVGEVLSRFEAKGLTIVALEHRTIDAAQADAHYAEHVERDFYPPLRSFVTSGPLVALVLEGDEAIEVVRAINGATDGRKAAPGTIRGDLSLSNRENLVHGSDSEESADPRDRDLVPPALTFRPGARRAACSAWSRHPRDAGLPAFFAAVRRRHPDVDIVLLPPEPAPEQPPGDRRPSSRPTPSPPPST